MLFTTFDHLDNSPPPATGLLVTGSREHLLIRITLLIINALINGLITHLHLLFLLKLGLTHISGR